MKTYTLFAIVIFWAISGPLFSQNQIPVKVASPSSGAPITMGVPFPKGALFSPDHIKVLNAKGKEIPSQITEVSNWEPIDPSIKWVWVFFFMDESANYTIVYGKKVKRAPYLGPRIKIKNNQRSWGYVEVSTGKLQFRVSKGTNGFIDKAYLDLGGDGYGENDLIASNEGGARFIFRYIG